MKVLITGSHGQLGGYLIRNAPKHIEDKNVNLICPTRSDLDLSDHKSCQLFLEMHKPDWIINSAAFTNVDQAEKLSDLTYNINTIAPKIFSQWILENGGNMLQISTDYVFDGLKSSPYLTKDKTNPLSIYGRTKESAEKIISNILFPKDQAKILRSSWLIGPDQNNFVHKILSLLKNKETLEVVYDQVSCPTNVIYLSYICWKIIVFKEKGIGFPNLLHWSDYGVASWFDIAQGISEIGYDFGLITSPAKLIPVTSDQYPQIAKRPAFSLLDISQTIFNLKMEPPYWRSSLGDLLKIKLNQ